MAKTDLSTNQRAFLALVVLGLGKTDYSVFRLNSKVEKDFSSELDQKLTRNPGFQRKTPSFNEKPS